jgi:hypothetical protein
MADLILSAVGFILELSELDEIHLKSYERAQSNQSMAIYTAKLLYNDAFENVPASDHPRMQGPVDLSEKKQVKAYKGLTAECEEEVYNMMCNVGPALLRAVATARFATAPAASADSPGPDAFNPGVLKAVAENVGAALGPALLQMSEVVATGQAHL